MKGFDIFTLLSCILQPGVAGYALRLNRAFGSQRVGWFVFCAFAALGCLHLVHLLQPSGSVFGIIDVLILGLLLVGMASAESSWADRVGFERRQQRLQDQIEKLGVETEKLQAANQNLLQQLLRREQREFALNASEKQFRTVFMENPVPMWVFDLRSLAVLAVNEAAQRLYGITEADFPNMNASQVHAAADVAVFQQYCARPSSPNEPPTVWRHCRKDGKILHVEVSMLDLHYDNNPSRLIAVHVLDAPQGL